MKMLEEFQKFILKGNVVDLSTGVIIGAAFAGIVNAFTKGLVEPVLALAGGGPEPDLKVPIAKKLVTVTEAGVTREVVKLIQLDLGIIVGAVISFLITAAVVFFLIVKPMNKLMDLTKKKEAVKPAGPVPPSEVELLAEIRDLLKKAK
jgi:large conductance mechanosensitive channel